MGHVEDLELAAMRMEIARAVWAKRLEYDPVRGLLFTAVSCSDGVRHYELTATPGGDGGVVFHDEIDEWSPNGWHGRICSIHVPGIRDMGAKEALQAARAAALNWGTRARRK